MTMSPRLTRRSLLAAGGATAALPLAACGPGAKDASADLLVSWYGGQPVHEGVEGAIAAYSTAHPDVPITTQKAPFEDYWDKLATQVAGGQGPDLVRMSMTWLSEYSDRGALLDLSDLLGGSIDVSALDEDAASAGTTGDGQFGIGQSSITQATFRNPALVQEHGLELPESWSWADFTEFTTGFAEQAGPGTFGTTDAGADFQLFEVFARQHGSELFDGQSLAVGADVLEEWLLLWQGLRDAGAAPPPEVTAESTGFETSPFATLAAAVTFGWVQQVTFFQPVVPDHPLEVADVPGSSAGDLSGQFVTALDFWSILSSSPRPDDAAALIDFLVNDPAAVTSIGLTLGVPPSSSSRDLLDAPADSAAAKAMAYVEAVTGSTGPPPPAWPKGYGALQGNEFGRLNEDVAFGRTTPSQAAASFLETAAAALAD
ncbi:ABC transporter substrate-binding protein [Brachybacterium alimentarium]|uniref:ABC transporter substrate-binding protein n=1 Tax=Brachybacterium alimentarium TaxID=47845 RepID=UPI000DF1925C|nr:ABC transporter substrate-binding protein [Brachybacterium alimentarium]RCS83544.1 carbohydrate ABC transporter substrate-binding protein [Brachybacterium alimentarium]